jgi:hypothetical protein
MRWFQSRADSHRSDDHQVGTLTRQRAIDEAPHLRQPELESTRSPRYGAFVEPVADRVRIHLLREWGERERRIDSVKCQMFEGADVEAAASFLEDIREEAMAREQHDLEEWISQRERAEARRARKADRAEPSRQSQRLSLRHQRELEEMRATRRRLEEQQNLAEKRTAAVEAHGLAEALIAQLFNSSSSED